MTRYILEAAMQVAVLFPLAILFLSGRTKQNYIRVLLFGAVYVFYQAALSMPKAYPATGFIDSNWNWGGKIFGIVFGVLCYFVLRRWFAEHDFFRLPEREHLRAGIIVSLAVVALAVVFALFSEGGEFNAETLAFQLTMPGIDEEIMFRGILLGLLASAFKEKISFLGNPAVLVTAVLFGLMHAFTLDKTYSIGFDPYLFVLTGIGGYAWGWTAVKTKSIVLPILSHNFSNFFASLTAMFKP